MARLFKKTETSIDPTTGKKIKKESTKWWGRWRDGHGIERRQPLSANKAIAQRILNEFVEKAELEKNGVISATEKESKRDIVEHIDGFEKHQSAKENTGQYVFEVVRKVRAMADHCHWRSVSQMRESDVEDFLLDLRRRLGRSIQTSNNYLRAIKCFTRWLVRTKRLQANPLEWIATLNTQTDRRHDRRPLDNDEFARLLNAAETGPPSVGLVGRDRAMLYLLAAWTGFRRGELGSLTLRSFDLESPTPTVSIEAAYSKHRRRDTQILHPDIVERFKVWLPQRKPKTGDEILFPVSKRTCGVDRKTSDMMQFDLAVARRFWIAETDDPEERRQREASEFLLYKNKAGLFADFHGLRHTFISNLSKAGVAPKTAQILARHSDIKLTLNIYTHVEQEAQIAAINALPGIPGAKKAE